MLRVLGGRTPAIFGPVRTTALSLALVLTACAPTLSVGAPCELNSDCSGALVCRNARCRTECVEARDCGPGLRCLQDGTCSLEREEICDAANPCPGALRCVFAQCRTECVTDDDCSRDGACEDGSCLEPRSGSDASVMRRDAGSDAPSCTPRPIACRDGTVQACGPQPALAVLTGATTGEYAAIPPHVTPGFTRPREGATALPPEIALGLSGDGYGVVGYLGDGDARNAHFLRFPLDDVGAASEVTLDDAITNGRSLVLGEHGERVLGLVLLTEPPGTGELSGYDVTFTEAGLGLTGTLGSGNPVGVPSGEMAVLGGTRSLGPSGSPFFFIARENKTPTEPPGPTEPTIGAIDEDIGFTTYRASSTTSLDDAQDYLTMGGSAGSVVIVHEPGTALYGLWNVGRTPELLNTITNPSGEPADHVQPFGGFDTNIGGPAIVQTGADGAYVLAIPTADLEGRGTNRLFTVSCVDDQPCATPAALIDLPTRTGRRPEMVRLASLRDGHAIATIEPDASGRNAVYLYLLDPNWIDVTGDDAPIVGIPTVAGEQVVALQLGSVSDEASATLLVAVLIRNESTTTDRIWIGGYRACIAR